MEFFRRKDLWVVFGLLVLCGALWCIYHFGFSGQGKVAELYYFSERVMSVPLDGREDRTFAAPGNDQVRFHLYEDGGIAFAASDCPDQVCVHTGKIRRVGETAACLPNGFLLKVVSPGNNLEEEELDAIT